MPCRAWTVPAIRGPSPMLRSSETESACCRAPCRPQHLPGRLDKQLLGTSLMVEWSTLPMQEGLDPSLVGELDSKSQN